MKILVHNIISYLVIYILIESTSLRCSLVRMELESSRLLAKKRPLHSVNYLHLISTLVGLLDDIVDNSVNNAVLPKSSRVCPSCFRSLRKQTSLDKTFMTWNQLLKEQLKQAIESGQLIS